MARYRRVSSWVSAYELEQRLARHKYSQAFFTTVPALSITSMGSFTIGNRDLLPYLAEHWVYTSIMLFLYLVTAVFAASEVRAGLRHARRAKEIREGI